MFDLVWLPLLCPRARRALLCALLGFACFYLAFYGLMRRREVIVQYRGCACHGYAVEISGEYDNAIGLWAERLFMPCMELEEECCYMRDDADAVCRRFRLFLAKKR